MRWPLVLGATALAQLADLPAPESVGRSQPSLYLPRVSLTGHFWASLLALSGEDGDASTTPSARDGAASTTTTAAPTDYYLEAFRALSGNDTNATAPTPTPTSAPTGVPTATPTAFPTSAPTSAPSAAPTAESPAPTPAPTPTPRPTDPAPPDTVLTVGIALTVSSEAFQEMRENVAEAESGLAAGFATFVGVQQSAVTVIDSSLRSRALQAGARRLAGEETTLEVEYAIASDDSGEDVASITSKLEAVSDHDNLAKSLGDAVEEQIGTTVAFTVDEVDVVVVPTPTPTPAPTPTPTLQDLYGGADGGRVSWEEEPVEEDIDLSEYLQWALLGSGVVVAALVVVYKIRSKKSTGRAGGSGYRVDQRAPRDISSMPTAPPEDHERGRRTPRTDSRQGTPRQGTPRQSDPSQAPAKPSVEAAGGTGKRAGRVPRNVPEERSLAVKPSPRPMDQLTLWRRAALEPEAALHDGHPVMVDVRQEYEGAHGRVSVKFRNVGAHPVLVSVAYDGPPSILAQPITGAKLAPGAQAVHSLRVKCLEPFARPPRYSVDVEERGEKHSLHLYLPTTMLHFFAPAKLAPNDFLHHWHQFSAEDQWEGVTQMKLETILSKGRLTIVYESNGEVWSPGGEMACGAASFLTLTPDPADPNRPLNVPVLARLERSMYGDRPARLTVRSRYADVSRGVRSFLQHLLLEGYHE